MTDTPDLFNSAIAARDREIERLRAALAEAEESMPVKSAPSGPAHVVSFPRFHRSRLVVNHVAVPEYGRTRYDCMAITADGSALVLSSISEVHLRRVIKAHERAGFVIEHRGRRASDTKQNTGGATA